MKYTIEDIDYITELNGWSCTICENEVCREYCYGRNTIQVAQEEDQDYFGEFVQDVEGDTYTFKFYIF